MSKVITSLPFYTPEGYKLQCYMDCNGEGQGKGTHLSVFVCILKGEYDAMLPWPFVKEICCGRYVIHLCGHVLRKQELRDWQHVVCG